MRLVYFIGSPGSGKSALMAELTKHLARWEERNPFAWTGLFQEGNTKPVAMELGHRPRGADGLPPNAAPFVTAWLKAKGLPALGEGDRLANDAFFQSVKDVGYQLTVIHVDTPLELCKARIARDVPLDDDLGKVLRRVHERGRTVEKLAQRWSAWRVDGTAHLPSEAARLARMHPLLKALYSLPVKEGAA